MLTVAHGIARFVGQPAQVGLNRYLLCILGLRDFDDSVRARR